MTEQNGYVDGDDYTWDSPAGGVLLQPAAAVEPDTDSPEAWLAVIASYAARRYELEDTIYDLPAVTAPRTVPVQVRVTEAEPGQPTPPDLRTGPEQERDDVAELYAEIDRLRKIITAHQQRLENAWGAIVYQTKRIDVLEATVTKPA